MNELTDIAMIHLRLPESLKRRIDVIMAKTGKKRNPELIPIIEAWVEKKEAELKHDDK